MGAIADGFLAYMQPLLEECDGSPEELEKAMMLGQLCFNLALLPTDSRDRSLREICANMEMDEEELDAFRCHILAPMIERHEEMFPFMHGGAHLDMPRGVLPRRPQLNQPAAKEKYPVPDRYAPCPCNSGEKFKFCCGAKGAAQSPNRSKITHSV